MNTGIGSGIMEIATGLMAIALIALLVRNASQTSQLVTTGASAFNNLLNTVTLGNSTGYMGTIG